MSLRVAVSGLGVICALGDTVDGVWQRVLRGDRGATPARLFSTEGQRSSLAAEVPDLVVPTEGGSPWSRTDALALSAARQALRAAKLENRTGIRLGIVVGGTTGGMYETEALLAKMHAEPSARVPNPAMLAHPLSATSDRLASVLGPFARTRTLCSACSSGANAFALGRAWLELDLVDAVLVGGADGLCRLTFTGFNALGAMDVGQARPFDARRRGLNIGEGAGFAVLEREERAGARGVPPLAELVGAGIVSEAHHITNPHESGEYPAEAIAKALKEAALAPTDVDYVNAHGTGTTLNDVMETAALQKAFGEETSRIYVSSTKGQIGHTLGAAGAIEAIFTVLAIRDGKVPPTGGLEQVDPACSALRHVVGAAAETNVRVALSNAFGFGGVDTVLAFAKLGYAAEQERPARAVWVTGIGSASRMGGLQWDENARLLEPQPAPAAGDPEVEDPTATLDLVRARRLDRAARLAASAAQLAWSSGNDGIFLGTSYGDPDASAAFLARVFAKGPRMAPPAEFPNLVPSSPSGHASIYLALHGPAIAIADLATSGEAAIVTAWELIASGFIDAATAGSVEGPSQIVESSIAPSFSDAAGEKRSEARRTTGAAVVRLTREPPPETAELVEERVIVQQVVQGATLAEVVGAMAPPFVKGAVVVSEITPAIREALQRTPWEKAQILEVAPAVGRHEGLGGFAVAAAAGLLLKGGVFSALILGTSPGRVYGLRLERP